MQKIGIAVVGCGRIANSGHLPAITDCSEEMDLIATVDILEDRARKGLEKFGARKLYTSVEKAFNDPDIDAVALCLPHHLHAPISIQACEAGKHVLVEKPMANSIEEADAMIEAAEKAGVALMIGQSRRFTDAVLDCKRRLHEIGDPLQVIVNWMGYIEDAKTEWWRSAEKTGGLLIPLQGSHAVDFALWILEKKPIYVFAQSHRYNSAWEGEDDAVIQLGFDDGVMASILLSFNAKYLPYEKFIIGTRGSMYIKDEVCLRINDQDIVKGEESNANFKKQYREFAASIREKREPMASGSEVRQVIEVLDAVKRSISETRVIVL